MQPNWPGGNANNQRRGTAGGFEVASAADPRIGKYLYEDEGYNIVAQAPGYYNTSATVFVAGYKQVKDNINFELAAAILPTYDANKLWFDTKLNTLTFSTYILNEASQKSFKGDIPNVFVTVNGQAAGVVPLGNGDYSVAFSGADFGLAAGDTAYIVIGFSGGADHSNYTAALSISAPPPGFTVTGQVKSYYPTKPATLELWLEGETEAAHTTYTRIASSGSGQAAQEFSFAGVEPGTYTLVITKAAHTGFTVHNIVVADGDVDLTADKRPEVQLLTLRCGDINGDGNINNSDLTILWRQANYNRSAAAADEPLCDLNGDGLINNIDLTILWLAYNYNRGEIEIQ
jgi:hypothetical protein